MDIYVTGFTLEHIPKSLSNGRIETATKRFTVWVSGEEFRDVEFCFSLWTFFHRVWTMRTTTSRCSLASTSTRTRMTRAATSTLGCRTRRLRGSSGLWSCASSPTTDTRITRAYTGSECMAVRFKRGEREGGGVLSGAVPLLMDLDS